MTAGSSTTEQVPTASATRLRFAPATRVLWRSADKVQLEMGSSAIIVEGLPESTVDQLCGRSDNEPASGDPRVAQLLSTLHRSGFLVRAKDLDDEVLSCGTARSMLLAPDLSALSERHGEAAANVLAGRAARRILIRGTGRLPAQIGSLLAAAGVGHICVAMSGDVVLRDAAPGGLRPQDEGMRLGPAASDAVRRAAADVDTSTIADHEADLIVLTTSAPLRAIGPPFTPNPWARTGQRTHRDAPTPHLMASVWGSAAVVGPLVVPGRTSCLRCADLHRCDRDPTWPALSAQLNVRRTQRDPSDVLVCAFAAAVAAAQAVSFLDGEHPGTTEGTLELSLPDWRLRRRSWPPHPDCGCTLNE